MGEARVPCIVCGRETRRLPTPAGLERYLAIYRMCPSCGHRHVLFTVVRDLEPDESPYAIFTELANF